MNTFEEAVRITIGSDPIAGTLITPGTLIPGVLFVHGWGGSQEQYLARAREISALGCICLTFDLRGHAQTRDQYESVSRAKNLDDVVAAYDLLSSRAHVDTSSIAVIGSSYGGYLSAILATVRPVKWLALRAPALYQDSGWDLPKLQLHQQQDLVAYRSHLIESTANRALQACRAFDGDVLLVESENDTIIPRPVLTSYREAFIHAHSLTYRCLEGSDHGLTTEASQRDYTTVLVAWLKEMLRGARVGQLPAPSPIPPGSPEVPPHASRQAA